MDTQLWAVGATAHTDRGDIIFGGTIGPRNFWMRDGKMWLDGCVGYGSETNVYGEVIGANGWVYHRNCWFPDGELKGRVLEY